MSDLPTFNNQALLTTALTHRSALNERLSDSPESYERLEFLGDAVLELCVTNFLYKQLPDQPEGVLTSFRSALVKTGSLAEIAQELSLGEKVFMSKGEERTGGRTNPSLLADAFEALLGGLYLDQGYDAVYAFLDSILFPKLAHIQEHGLHRDFKSTLQEKVQAEGLPTPEYRVESEEGPDHEKTFTVAVFVGEKKLSSATGTSKQRAEQAAAKLALEKKSEK